MEKFLRAPAVRGAMGIGHTKLYALIADGMLPPGVKVGSRTVAWPAGEIAAVQKGMIAGLDAKAQREMVQGLIANRTAGEEL